MRHALCPNLNLCINETYTFAPFFSISGCIQYKDCSRVHSCVQRPSCKKNLQLSLTPNLQSQTFSAVRSALKTAAEVVFNAQQAAAKQIAASKKQKVFFVNRLKKEKYIHTYRNETVKNVYIRTLARWYTITS